MINSLGAVFIRVSHLEESIKFYSDVLKLNFINKEEWEDGRGANYHISPGSPLITLIESAEVQPNKFPSFNLNCSNIYETYEVMKKEGIKVGKINKWSSERNDHIDFDVYDPDENPINLIECKSRTAQLRYEAGIDGHRERKSTTVGEITSFVWPINMWIHDMNAVAFNKDGEALFGYGFLENDNYINIEKDLRWHRIEK